MPLSSPHIATPTASVRWTWAFRAERFTVFHIDPSRGSEVLIALLGQQFRGVLGCDYFSAYRKYLGDHDVVVQFCLAHLIRDLKFLTTLPPAVVVRWAKNMLSGMRRLFGIIHRRESMTPEKFQRALARARDVLLERGKRGPTWPEVQNLVQRFKEHGDAYFHFVTTPGIAPTNNLAEQALRFVVIDRRLTQGTRSVRGRRWCQRIWTAAATCLQQGRSLFAYLCSAVAAFFAGDPAAGSFMAGFFPVMMFGLPAACLAMYRTATVENKVKVGSLLLSAALVSLATGITEPIEFAFMFAAPALYAVHAVLTGVSLVVMNLLHVKLGFTFSAGAIDYVLSYGKSQHGWMAIPVGVVYFALYYGIFTLCIRRFKFTTLGREPLLVEGETDAEAALPAARNRAHGYILALGGIDNIVELEACATRLRVNVKNSQIVLDPALKGAGAMGVVRPSDGSIQVVVGPIADAVADEINAEIRATRLASGDALAASRS